MHTQKADVTEPVACVNGRQFVDIPSCILSICFMTLCIQMTHVDTSLSYRVSYMPLLYLVSSLKRHTNLGQVNQGKSGQNALESAKSCCSEFMDQILHKLIL